ncbi:PucR family transcriptional regulator [Clostridium sp. UBA4548]|uniref:PucR family transcriptional regulator n=1 Tax=Clostridium sp. UBA4548 TaxID=1946361 RepID=UPI0025BE6B63|nr:PucR family transcriptional regulator [Clostridium sp. UBA4548]
MAITIIEATKLETFKNFRLISGISGLNREVEKVGILDWEFFSKSEWVFNKGEFVLTSLLFARDNPEFILEAVKELIKDGASGLAFKNIYYKDLPMEVIDYSNKNSFPIFIFDNSVYFEDIITEVMDKIRFSENHELMESKIDILIKKSLNKTTVKEIALEINSSFKENFFVVYCKNIKYIHSDIIISSIERLKRKKIIGLHSTALKYRNGLLIIFTEDRIDLRNFKNSVDHLINTLGIEVLDYYIGVSSLHSTLVELDQGIKESLFAQKTGEVSTLTFNYFNDIGIFSILMPFVDETWMQGFYNRILHPIKSYDEKYNSELFHTAIKYIENDGKIIETANTLFLHKNTIRYRIGKIKELLNMEDCEGSFYEQLSIAVKLYKIYNL